MTLSSTPPRQQLSEIMGLIRDQLQPQQFELWFRRIQWDNLNDGQLVLNVPNDFCRNWIERHYLDLVKAAAQQVLDDEHIQVEIGINPRLEEEKVSVDTAAPASSGNGSGGASLTLGSESQPAPPPPAAVTSTRQDEQEFFTSYGVNPALREQTTFENFVIGPANRMPHAACLAVAENLGNVYNPLFLHGAVGLGKTHLLQAICHSITERKPSLRFVYISCEEFVNEFIKAIELGRLERFRQFHREYCDVLVIDDIHFLANKDRTQEEFFHTFNCLYNARRQIVLSSDSSPKEIPNMEARLVSRFEWGLVTKLEPPHFETRVAILRKKAKLKGFHLPEEVVSYIASQLDTNIRELEGAITTLVGHSSLMNRPIDLELAKEALRGTLPATRHTVNITDIQSLVISEFKVKLADLQSRKRTKSISFPRQVCMYLARQLTELSYEEIGGYFGGRDHSTVKYGYDTVSKKLKDDSQLRELIESMTRTLRG